MKLDKTRVKLFPNFTRHHLITHTNTTRDISKLSQIVTRLTARQITYNNFEISLVVFMPNITTNHAITYTNKIPKRFFETYAKHI